MLDLPITREAFLWACSIACQVTKVPLSTNRILKRHQPPFTLGALREAAQHDGLPIRQKSVPVGQLEKLPMPCLVTLLPPSDGGPGSTCCDPVAPGSAREYHIGLLLKADNRTVEIAEVCGRESCVLPRDAFDRRFAGEVLLFGQPPVVSEETAGRTSRGRQSSLGTEGSPRPTWFASAFPWFRALRRAPVRRSVGTPI